jgi:primosomal protein N' (replication factor Y)
VQSFSPGHYAIRPVVDHDYESFYTEEISHRSALGYPPFGRLAQVVVSGTEEGEAREAAAQLARELPGCTGCEVLGPAPAPIARLRGRHRFQLLIKGSDRAAVWQMARRTATASGKLPAAVRVRVDVNPVDML